MTAVDELSQALLGLVDRLHQKSDIAPAKTIPVPAITGTARIACGAGLCNGTVSVRLSVCLIRPLQQRAAGLLLRAW